MSHASFDHLLSATGSGLLAGLALAIVALALLSGLDTMLAASLRALGTIRGPRDESSAADGDPWATGFDHPGAGRVPGHGERSRGASARQGTGRLGPFSDGGARARPHAPRSARTSAG